MEKIGQLETSLTNQAADNKQQSEALHAQIQVWQLFKKKHFSYTLMLYDKSFGTFNFFLIPLIKRIQNKMSCYSNLV